MAGYAPVPTATGGVRAPAAVQALGGPKLTKGQPATTTTKLPRTVKAPAPKVPKASAPKAGGKTIVSKAGSGQHQGQPPGAPVPPHQQPSVFNPLGGYLNSQQLAGLAQSIEQSDQNAALAPLRQQSQQIQGVEQTVAGRMAGYTGLEQQQLGGLQGQIDAGAKTAENRAAELATRTASQVDQTGKAAASVNAGYTDPQVAQQLGIGSTQLGANAGAGAGFAAARGQNAGDFMTSMRGAAATRAVEGQQNIASLYGGQLGKNEAQQQAVIAKGPSDLGNLETKLGQQQFTDYITQGSLKVKQTAEQINAAKATVDAQYKAGLISQGQARNQIAALNAQTNATRASTTAANQSGTLAERIRNNKANNALRASSIAVQQLRAANKGAPGLTLSQQNSIGGKLGAAYDYIQAVRTQSKDQAGFDLITQGLLTGKGVKNGATTIAAPKGISDPRIVTAALHLWQQSGLTPQDVQTLKGMGVKNIPSDWTSGRFNGFGKPLKAPSVPRQGAPGLPIQLPSSVVNLITK